VENQDYKDILSYMYEGVYVVDKQRKIIFWNSGSEEITGYKKEEVMNRFCHNNILQHVTAEGTELCFSGCPLHSTLETGEIREANVFLHHKEGHRVPVTVKSIPVFDNNNNIVAAIEVFTDSRYKKTTYEENRRLKNLLTIDELTGISNRRHLDFNLRNMISESNEFSTSFGILFLDIDNFKDVNDTYGHNVGDEVLKLISRTIKSSLRLEDKIGRWGGEEFIALIKTNDKKELTRIAEKLRLLVSHSYYKIEDSEKLKVTISIGGAMYEKGEDVESLISRADKNMYFSKDNGRNKVTIK